MRQHVINGLVWLDTAFLWIEQTGRKARNGWVTRQRKLAYVGQHRKMLGVS